MNACLNCFNPSLFKCEACLFGTYCSFECQGKHWNIHSKYCALVQAGKRKASEPLVRLSKKRKTPWFLSIDLTKWKSNVYQRQFHSNLINENFRKSVEMMTPGHVNRAYASTLLLQNFIMDFEPTGGLNEVYKILTTAEGVLNTLLPNQPATLLSQYQSPNLVDEVVNYLVDKFNSIIRYVPTQSEELRPSEKFFKISKLTSMITRQDAYTTISNLIGDLIKAGAPQVPKQRLSTTIMSNFTFRLLPSLIGPSTISSDQQKPVLKAKGLDFLLRILLHSMTGLSM